MIRHMITKAAQMGRVQTRKALSRAKGNIRRMKPIVNPFGPRPLKAATPQSVAWHAFEAGAAEELCGYHVARTHMQAARCAVNLIEGRICKSWSR